jgi:hypothetical protein
MPKKFPITDMPFSMSLGRGDSVGLKISERYSHTCCGLVQGHHRGTLFKLLVLRAQF